MKPLTYDRLLSLSEDALKEAFPHGASMTASGKWLPAQRGKASLTLSKLLKEKLARLDKPRFPARTQSQNIVYDRKTRRWKPGPERPDQDRGYTENPARALDFEPGIGPVDGVSDLDLARFAAEAREKDAVRLSDELQRKELRSYIGRLRQLAIDHYKAGGDPAPVFESALQQLQEKKAA